MVKKTKNLDSLKKEPNSSWGGVREGAGRKPRLQYEVRELFNVAVDEEWKDLTRILFYYIHKGDKDMLKWVLEQRIGKAPQSVDLSTKGVFMTASIENTTNQKNIDVMEIAKEVSARLKILKTQN